jgi:long-chain acyl-CoA synthetase
MYLTQGLHRSLSLFPDREATTFLSRRQTYRQLADRVARCAGALRRLGVAEGDRVALLALNSDRYFEYYLAVFWAGAAVNPVNTRWTAAEIVYSLRDSETTVLIVDDHFAAMAADLRRDAKTLKHLLHLGEHESPAACLPLELLIAEADPVEDAFRSGHELAGVFYTGGTTGFPKGVKLHHDGITSAALCRLALGYVPGPAYLHAAPLFHLAGAIGLFTQLLNGGRHVITPAFEPRVVMQAIERERISDTLLVPTMIQMLLDHPERSNYDLSSLRFVVYGAAPISETLLDRAFAALPDVSFMQGYGMTELSGPLIFLEPRYHTVEGRKLGKLKSAGRASLFAETRIADTDGRVVPRGTVGEICVRAPSMMLGYWNRPDETAAVLVDGWMHSGDGGYMDDEGFLYIVDRVKDMIVSGGENVYSAEVENAIAKHPAVAACAVIGIPDAHWGEAVHAVIVPRPGVAVTAEQIIGHCKQLIAGYKSPRSVEFREALPLTGAGKVMKHQLREPFWQGVARRVN